MKSIPVRITNEAHEAIRRHVRTELLTASSKHLDSGDWIVYLSEETIEGLNNRKLPGETDSDAIIRVASILEQGLQ